MKSKIIPTRFSVLLVISFFFQLFLWSELSAQKDSVVFNYKHEPQTWIVPKGVTKVHVDAYGAQGGSEQGGKGGRLQSDLKVTSGSTLFIKVGSQPKGNEGGYNGGGKGCGEGTGGGGASDIRIGGVELKNRVLVVGGGGGFGHLGYSGVGGGLQGGDGGYDSLAYHAAKGGTQTAGGEGAKVYYSPSGKLGVGGDGISSRGKCINEAMGGGGGGYYGGGGGGGGGAGGGSSYTNDSNTNVDNQQGVEEGNGKIIIYWDK